MNEAFAIVLCDKTLKTTTQEKEHPTEIANFAIQTYYGILYTFVSLGLEGVDKNVISVSSF